MNNGESKPDEIPLKKFGPLRERIDKIHPGIVYAQYIREAVRQRLEREERGRNQNAIQEEIISENQRWAIQEGELKSQLLGAERDHLTRIDDLTSELKLAQRVAEEERLTVERRTSSQDSTIQLARALRKQEVV